MPDITQRLRQCAATMRQHQAATIDAYELDNAADEIERLRSEVEELRRNLYTRGAEAAANS